MKKFKKIYIEITNRCNLSCSFCSKVDKPLRNMTIDEFKIILDKIKNYTDTVYFHVKGEPFVHPNLVDFLNIAEEYNLKVNITTNGTLFPKIVDKIKDCASLKKINFSLHSENDYSDYVENILLKSEANSLVTGTEALNLVNYFYKNDKIQINIR